MMNSLELGVYRHAKTGREYELIGTALHTETGELIVVYRPLYESEHQLFVRPLEMFDETVMIDGQPRPRFEFVHA